MTALVLTLSDGKIYLALLALVLASALIELACRELRFAVVIRVPLFAFNLLLTMLLIGLRWEVGTDWGTYKELFDTLELNQQFLLHVYHFDPGYVFLNAAVKAVFNNYTFFLLICAASALGLVAWAIVKISPLYNLSLFVFIASYLPIHFFGSIRRGIAIGAATFFLIAIDKATVPRRWQWTATAFLFHRTALAVLVAAPLRRLRFSRRVVWILLLAALAMGIGGVALRLIQLASAHLLGFANLQIVDQLIYYGNTFSEHTPEGVNPVVSGLVSYTRKLILFIFFLRALPAGKERSPADVQYEHLLKVYVLGTIIYGVFIGAPIFQVVAVYFLYVEVLLIPLCLYRLKSESRYLFLMYVVAMNFAQYISALTVLPEVFLPYRSVLF